MASPHCGHLEVIPLGPLGDSGRHMPESFHLRGRGAGLDTLSHHWLRAAPVASGLPLPGQSGLPQPDDDAGGWKCGWCGAVTVKPVRKGEGQHLPPEVPFLPSTKKPTLPTSWHCREDQMT